MPPTKNVNIGTFLAKKDNIVSSIIYASSLLFLSKCNFQMFTFASCRTYMLISSFEDIF